MTQNKGYKNFFELGKETEGKVSELCLILAKKAMESLDRYSFQAGKRKDTAGQQDVCAIIFWNISEKRLPVRVKIVETVTGITMKQI